MVVLDSDYLRFMAGFFLALAVVFALIWLGVFILAAQIDTSDK